LFEIEKENVAVPKLPETENSSAEFMLYRRKEDIAKEKADRVQKLSRSPISRGKNSILENIYSKKVVESMQQTSAKFLTLISQKNYFKFIFLTLSSDAQFLSYKGSL